MSQVLQSLGRTFRPVLGKIRPLRKKSGPLNYLNFWRHLDLRKKLSVSLCVAKVSYFFDFPELQKIRGRKQSFKKFNPGSAHFRPFLYKIDQNSVADVYFLFGPFCVCGRTIRQLATRNIAKIVRVFGRSRRSIKSGLTGGVPYQIAFFKKKIPGTTSPLPSGNS